MAQPLADDLDVNALLEHQARLGVAEVMESQMPDADEFQDTAPCTP